MQHAVFSFLIAFVMFLSLPAHADFHVWQDDKSGVVWSFPDTWRVTQNKQPDDVMTLAAPSGDGYASCRMRVKDDRRFMIYPPKHSEAIQRVAYSDKFWQNYLEGFSDPQIHILRNNASIGRGVAGYVLASFSKSNPGPMMRRKAMIFATSYYDKLYMLECSAAEHAFDRWRLSFLSIAKSVDFKKTHHELITGEYSDFTGGLFMTHGYDAQGYFFY